MMGPAATNAIEVMAELGEELPFLNPVLGTIKGIREIVESVQRHQDELAALEERCTYFTACVIEKHRLMPTLEKDVTPLKNCVDAVEAFVKLCGRGDRLGSLVKACNDKNEIAGLHARIDRLAGDLQLAGIVPLEEKDVEVCFVGYTMRCAQKGSKRKTV